MRRATWLVLAAALAVPARSLALCPIVGVPDPGSDCSLHGFSFGVGTPAGVWPDPRPPKRGLLFEGYEGDIVGWTGGQPFGSVLALSAKATVHRLGAGARVRQEFGFGAGRALSAAQGFVYGLPDGALVPGNVTLGGQLLTPDPLDRGSALFEAFDFEDRLLGRIRVDEDDSGNPKVAVTSCDGTLPASDTCVTAAPTDWTGSVQIPITYRAVAGNGIFTGFEATARRSGGASPVTTEFLPGGVVVLTPPPGATVHFASGLHFSPPPGIDEGIAALVSQVSPTRLRRYVEALEGERATTAQLADAAAYIQAELEAYGYEVVFESTPAGPNLVATLPGSLQPGFAFVVGAHYDTVPGSPGADDNASGVAGLLEIARILAGAQTWGSVEFVAFAGEELGLIGSRRHAELAREARRDLAGMLSLEMIGYTCHTRGCQFPFIDLPDCFDVDEPLVAVGDYIGVAANTWSEGLRNHFREVSALYAPELHVVSGVVYSWGECLSDTRRSDHAPYWDNSYSALMLTDTANFRNIYYHSSEDTSEKLDFEFMADVTRAALALAAARAVVEAPCGRGADADGDGVCDSGDNCTEASNPDQRDTNRDGLGNRCDADLNDDGFVDLADLAAFRGVFFTADPHADLDGDGFVNLADLALFKRAFLLPPGPAAPF
jgi:hypothetical protein